MRPTGTVLSLFFCFYLFCILFFVEAGNAPLSQSTTITHQAHSFDDLGQWRQLIAKGTNFIKVDLKYTLYSFCSKQPRVFNHDNRGCYLLTHDFPLAHQTYYTAYDMVAFIIDPNNAYLFENQTNFYLYIAFKNNRDRFPPANISQSDVLQKEFITFFTNQLRFHNLTNIQLVYDGIYLDETGRSYNWPRTYAFQASDINVSTSCLYSNNKKCKNTTVINNMANPLPFVDPSLSVLRLCEVGFGKYINSPYPWVFYEPTDQQTVFKLVDTYLECGIEHDPGFAVSINVDPIQYDVFTGTRSGKAWNQRLFDNAKWAHAVPLSFADSTMNFVTLYLTQDDHIMYTFSQGALDVPASNGVFPFGEIALATPRILSTRIRFAASPFQKLKTFTFSAGRNQFMFVSDFRGSIGIFAIDSISQSLTPVANATFTHKQSESVTSIIASEVTDADEPMGNSQTGWIKIEFLQGYTSFRRTECTFYIQWWELRFDPTGEALAEFSPVGSATCAVYSPFTLPLPVDSATIAVEPISSRKGNSSFCTNSTHAGLIVVSSHKNIHAGVLCVNTQSLSVKVCTDRTCEQSQADLQQAGTSEYPTLPAIDVGTFPSLSLIDLPDGEPVVLEVHGDGYCYNSDLNNKRATPNICANVPVSSRYVLNYNYGRLYDWVEHIYENKGVITSCDSAIFHGAYDEGSLPSAFLMLDNENNVRMIEAHSGFPVGAVDYAGCSWPVPYDGAMIDGIVMPSLVLMQGGDMWEPSEELMNYVTPKNNYDNYIYSHTGQVTIAESICDMCKERLFTWQSKYQSDYELLQSLTLKLSNMCTLGQLLIGDGTVPGCKNLILLYFPSLASDMATDIFSPDNCLLMGVCAGNKSSVLPDLNSQVARSLETPLNRQNELAHLSHEGDADAEIAFTTYERSRSQRMNDANPQLVAAIRHAVKTNLLALLGL